jgi:hypothetical protein
MTVLATEFGVPFDQGDPTTSPCFQYGVEERPAIFEPAIEPALGHPEPFCQNLDTHAVDAASTDRLQPSLNPYFETVGILRFGHFNSPF